jgi:hypothetical protein
MRPRHHQPPAIRLDPLDKSGDVAIPVGSILSRAGFVGEHERPEKDSAQLVVRKDDPGLPLRSAELGELLELALLLDSAGERRVGDIVERPRRFGAQLDHPAAVEAVRDRTSHRRVGVEKRTFARDVAGMAARPGGGERRNERVAPVTQTGAVVLGGNCPPVGRWRLDDLGRRPRDCAPGAGKQQEGQRQPHRPQPRQPSSRRPC